jgi:TolB-like protein
LALRPSVVVLPFANLSGDPELAFFADGVTEDLITALSRFQTFAVVGRASSFAYKGRAVPAPEIAQALGVRYILDGSVRRDGHRLRIAAHLTGAEEGTLLWAETFQEELGGVFEIQDRVTASVVAIAEPQITRAELERSRRKHPENMDAYDHYLQGLALKAEPNRTAAQHDRTVSHFDRAAGLDPGFPHALAYAGFAHEQRHILGGATPPGVDDFALASDLCQRALAQAGRDAVVLVIAAIERHGLGDDGEAALALSERALALNPNSSFVLTMAAFIHRQRGRADRAIGLYEHALRLDPTSPHNAMRVENIGCCHLREGRYAEAVEYIRRALAMGASWDLALVNLVVAEALLGEMDAARSTLERFLRVRPGATIRGMIERLPPGARGGEGRIWTEGLRRAGLPEG